MLRPDVKDAVYLLSHGASGIYLPWTSPVFEGRRHGRSWLPPFHGSQPHEEFCSSSWHQLRSICQWKDIDSRSLRHFLGSGSPDCLRSEEHTSELQSLR